MKELTPHLLIVALLVVLMAGLAATRDPEVVAENSASTESAERPADETEPSSPFGGPSRRVFASGRLVQSIYVSDHPAHADGNQQQLLVRYSERDPVSDEMRETIYPMSASGEILAVASRSYNDFLVALKVSSDKTLIERWVIADPKGAQTASRALAPDGIGQPYSPGPVSLDFAGGTWIAPGDRKNKRTERRVLLQIVTDMHAVRHLTMDPDGRFFLMQIGDEIRRYPTNAHAQYDILETAISNPAVKNLRGLSVAQSSVYGRMYYGSFYVDEAPERFGDFYVLGDSENDGLFEVKSIVGNTMTSSSLLLSSNPTASIQDTFRLYD